MMWAETDLLSPGAGWAGAGLLGAVLAWLFLRHLPAKDAQITALIENKDRALQAKDEQIKELIAGCDLQMLKVAQEYREEAKQTRSDFQASLNIVVTHHDKQEAATVQALREEMRNLADTIKAAKT